MWRCPWVIHPLTGFSSIKGKNSWRLSVLRTDYCTTSTEEVNDCLHSKRRRTVGVELLDRHGRRELRHESFLLGSKAHDIPNEVVESLSLFSRLRQRLAVFSAFGREAVSDSTLALDVNLNV